MTWPSGYLLQTVGGLWRADLPRSARGRGLGWWVVGVPAAVLVAIVVTAVVVGLRERRRRAALLASALAVGSVVVWSAALLANASANGRWSRSDPGALLDATPSRYAAAAGMLLSAALVVSASVLVGHVLRSGAVHTTGTDAGTDASTGTDATSSWAPVGPGGPRASSGGRSSRSSPTWVAAFPVRPQRATGPEWYPQVVAAEARCRQDPAGTVMIGALPWEARVPCVLVLGTGARPGGDAAPQPDVARKARCARGVRGPSPVDGGSSFTARSAS